jgi:hypothetical protein
MEKRTLEITLHGIRVPVTGTVPEKETSHLLAAGLIWPRTGTAKKSSSQSFALKEGAAEFGRVNWGRRILFRETVEGRFALEVTLTENLDHEELEKFLRFWAGAALGLGADAADKAAGPLGDIAAAPLDYAAKAVAKYPGASLLAEGMAELEAAEFPPPGGERLLTVRLVAARRLVRVTRRAVSGKGPAQVSRKLLLEKGADNGEVTLLARSL